jgi:hypothetical protein
MTAQHLSPVHYYIPVCCRGENDIMFDQSPMSSRSMIYQLNFNYGPEEKAFSVEHLIPKKEKRLRLHLVKASISLSLILLSSISLSSTSLSLSRSPQNVIKTLVSSCNHTSFGDLQTSYHIHFLQTSLGIHNPNITNLTPPNPC